MSQNHGQANTAAATTIIKLRRSAVLRGRLSDRFNRPANLPVSVPDQPSVMVTVGEDNVVHAEWESPVSDKLLALMQGDNPDTTKFPKRQKDELHHIYETILGAIRRVAGAVKYYFGEVELKETLAGSRENNGWSLDGTNWLPLPGGMQMGNL